MSQRARFRRQSVPKQKRARQRGYMLITLMLFITLLTIGLVAMLPDFAQQVKRDREEEMMHRAVGYARAIRTFYKKFGRYPTRIEELENTNNIRFLRKRYKDPLTGKDFRILHMQDVALNNGPVLPGQTGFVANPTGGVRQAGPSDTNLPQVTGLPQPAVTGAQKDQDADAPDTNSEDATKGQPGSPSPSSGGLTGPVFGGGPILGVASTSKGTTIRVCNKKDHYNDWFFIYDPSTDRGGLLNTCWQQGAGINGATPVGAMTAQPGQQMPMVGPGVGPVVVPQSQPAQNPNSEPGVPPEQ